MYELSKNVLSSQRVSKHALNVAYSEFIWPSKLAKWKSKSTVDDRVISSLGDDFYWFSIPEFSEKRKQLEVESVDATHLFTRLRRHCCKGKTEELNSSAWIYVARENNTFLTPAMVEEIVDPMSVSMTRTYFSETIEKEMHKHGFTSEADFCRDVRQWWESNDDPCISSMSRIRLREPLRKRLLQNIDFTKFPPSTSYIKGIPIQLWEALLIDIDAKHQLYGLTESAAYNVRGFSSMMGETFFAEFTLHDSRGHCAVTCQDFSAFIDQAIEQMNALLNENR